MDNTRNPLYRHLRPLPSRLPHVALWIAGVTVTVASAVAVGSVLG